MPESQIATSVVKQMLNQQREDFSAMVTAMMNSFNERYDQLRVTVTEIRVSLEYSQQEIANMKDTLQIQGKDHQTSDVKIDKVQQNLTELENCVDYLENQSRRNNVIFEGIEESDKESWHDSERKVMDVIKETMELEDLTIERAHRVGRARSRARPVVVKFLSYKDRELVMRNGRKLKGTSITVRDDVSNKVLSKRKELMPRLREARENGKVAFFSYDKLIVKDRLTPAPTPTVPAKDDQRRRVQTKFYNPS